jgi:outer membrane lipoprotein LolB
MIRQLGFLLVLFALTGCAALTRPVPQTRDGWDPRHLSTLETLDSWRLQARVATSRVGFSGSMNWLQEAGRFDIRVSGPLGSNGFQARGTPERVEVRTARETFVTSDPEQLVAQEMGWHFPLRHLRYWAVGLPQPGLPSTLKFDQAGRVSQLAQDGWVLEYTDYARFGERELPKRFTLDNGDVTIRVVVDSWTGLG